MKWSAIDPRDGWRTRFAFIPVKIGDELVWLERYERRFMGEYYEVRALHALSASPEGEGSAQRECPLSPNGRHQVDTSMESGPNNCFHCEKPMPTNAAQEQSA